MVIHSYPWYIADWRGSETRIRMTLEERAIYRDLLDHCWEQGSLPNDEQMLAKICSATPSEFKRSWPAVKKSFIEDGDRIRHAKVDAKRPEVIRLTEQRREAGKASAEARAKRASQRSSNERSTSVETSASTLLQPSSTTTSTTTITSNKDISPSPMANGGVVDLDPIPLEGRNGELSVGKVKRERKVFVKPTMEEVEAYCSEHKITNVNPKKFFWKNESNGWVTGRAKTPMKDWKAAIQTWAQNDYDSPQPSMFGGNKSSYQQIEDSWAVPD